MSPWWPSLGLLSWCPVFKSSHCNSFEDRAYVDGIYVTVTSSTKLTISTKTGSKMSSFCHFRHWLHCNLSKCQLFVQTATEISPKWQRFHFIGWRCAHLITPWVAIQASRCAWRVDRILAVKNPGVSLHPSDENGGRVASPGTIAVLFQDIPGEKDSLLIRYPDLIRTMYWV